MPDIFVSQERAKTPIEPVKREVKEILGKTQVKEKEHSLLAAYIRRPKNVDFDIKDQDEQVELLLRMHPITNVKWILIALVMFFAPVILGQFPILDFLPANFKFIVVLGWYLITFSFILENFLTWYYNVYIITDERIIDVDFYNLIYKEITHAGIDKIQDTTIKMGGVIRSIFNYGDIFIQTASEIPHIDFLAVPNPDKVVKILNELMIEEQKEALEGRVR